MKFSLVIGAALAAGSAMAQQIQVIVNGNPVNFSGQPPVMNNDRVLVPLRGVLEEMGAHVDWDPSTQTVRAHRQGTDVQLTIGQNTAAVNHHPVNLDVPAQIINGSTMVPLRFIGEALGERVKWDASQNSVVISDQDNYDLPTHGHDGPPPPPHHNDRPIVVPPPVIFTAGWVIPVSLDTNLNSDTSNDGDQFWCEVINTPQFPPHTRIFGTVTGARPQEGDQPGMLELHFTMIEFPGRNRTPINGVLIDLHDKNLEHKGDHVWAKNSETTNRAAITGYGAGAGLIIGLATHKPIRDAGLGALLGYAAGSLQKSQPHDVHLRRGQQFGVHLLTDAVWKR